MSDNTRPLRSAEDREQERANLAAEREQLAARIAWLDALIEHLGQEAADQPGTGDRLGEYMCRKDPQIGDSGARWPGRARRGGRVGRGESMTDMQRLVEEIAQWGERTFPGVTDAARIAHLRREVEELAAEPGSAQELADCFILLCQLACRHNVDLEEAVLLKLTLNKLRRWGKPDVEGVVEHEREAAAVDAALGVGPASLREEG